MAREFFGQIRSTLWLTVSWLDGSHVIIGRVILYARWMGHYVLQWKHSDVIKWKHIPCYRPFVRGPVNSPHKGQWRGALMLFFFCAWTNGWVNNPSAVFRRHRAHYGVTVIRWKLHRPPQCWKMAANALLLFMISGIVSVRQRLKSFTSSLDMVYTLYLISYACTGAQKLLKWLIMHLGNMRI